jgi:hypothetical protein
MKNFLRKYGMWFFIPIWIITIIILFINNPSIEIPLTVTQFIILCLMLYGINLINRDIKEQRKKYISEYHEKIKEIKASQLLEKDKDIVIKMCQTQINKLKKLI